MKMIRKQLYIEPEQQRKLRLLAREWSCTEADVVRRAIDRLPASDDPIVRALYESGLLVEPPDDGDDLSDEEIERMEQEWDAIVEALPVPLRLSDAIDEDREDRI